jgi:hypothetical protein
MSTYKARRRIVLFPIAIGWPGVFSGADFFDLFQTPHCRRVVVVGPFESCELARWARGSAFRGSSAAVNLMRGEKRPARPASQEIPGTTGLPGPTIFTVSKRRREDHAWAAYECWDYHEFPARPTPLLYPQMFPIFARKKKKLRQRSARSSLIVGPSLDSLGPRVRRGPVPSPARRSPTLCAGGRNNHGLHGAQAAGHAGQKTGGLSSDCFFFCFLATGQFGSLVDGSPPASVRQGHRFECMSASPCAVIR